jgi:hypothetical protein
VAVNFGIIIISFILTLTEIIMLGCKNLKPGFYLISNVVKSAAWIGLTVAGVIISRSEYHGYTGGLSIVVSIILL